MKKKSEFCSFCFITGLSNMCSSIFDKHLMYVQISNLFFKNFLIILNLIILAIRVHILQRVLGFVIKTCISKQLAKEISTSV